MWVKQLIQNCSSLCNVFLIARPWICPACAKRKSEHTKSTRSLKLENLILSLEGCNMPGNSTKILHLVFTMWPPPDWKNKMQVGRSLHRVLHKVCGKDREPRLPVRLIPCPSSPLTYLPVIFCTVILRFDVSSRNMDRTGLVGYGTSIDGTSWAEGPVPHRVSI